MIKRSVYLVILSFGIAWAISLVLGGLGFSGQYMYCFSWVVGLLAAWVVVDRHVGKLVLQKSPPKGVRSVYTASDVDAAPARSRQVANSALGLDPVFVCRVYRLPATGLLVFYEPYSNNEPSAGLLFEIGKAVRVEPSRVSPEQVAAAVESSLAG